MPDLSSNGLSMKERFHSGEQFVAVSLTADKTQDEVASIMEKGNYDFIFIDSQHAAYNEEKLAGFCAMAAEMGIHVQFRVKHTRNTYLVGNYMDLGPGGVEIPQVELESTVEETVQNFYYPPLGIRSWGGKARLGIKTRNDRSEYSKWWTDHGVVWIQLESVNAVKNAKKLVKSGVDCLSFGPNDLMFDLETNANSQLKTVDDCLNHVVKQLAGTDTAVCTRLLPPTSRQHYFDLGVSIIVENLP